MSDQKSFWSDENEVKVVDGRPVLLSLQDDLLTRGKAAYKNGVRRVIFQAPCGSGKTVIASEQTRRSLELGNDSILHVVHRRRLVDQMVDQLMKFGIVASPIMEGRHRWSAKVYCASRDTLLAMLKDGRELPKAKLIIWDECHVASVEVASWYLANCPGSYWTGYTATPVRANGDSMKPPYQELVCMGPPAELQKIGRLCAVKVFNPDAVGQRRRKGEKVKPVGDPIDHWQKYAGGLPTVVFASTVKDSKDIAQRYIASGISAEHIDAFTSDDRRDEVFERSRTGETKIICNCGVLIEGVDLPWLVCCQILRGCNSLILWVQATGRVLRAFPGKQFGIVLDHSGAAHEFGMPDSDFQWSLGDGKANELLNALPKDRKPVTCPACGAVFSPKPACPECGHVMPRQRRKSTLSSLVPGDGVLTEFTGEQRESIRHDALARLWNKFLYMGRAKGWAMRQVAGAFSREAKCPPWEAGLDVPLPHGKDGWAIPAVEWIQIAKGEVA